MTSLKSLKALALGTLLVAPSLSEAATIYAIDINTVGSSVTASGWTGLDAPFSTDGGSVTLDGIVFSLSSSDGSRLRGSVASPNPNALTGDFAFDDGPGQAIILNFGVAGDLAAGTWKVEVWTLDSGAAVGDQILGLRTNNSEDVASVIDGSPQVNGRISNTVSTSADSPAATFTFLSNGSAKYDVFLRENNSQNRSRLNAVRLTLIPEPSSAGVLGLLGATLLIRRRR